MGSYGEILIDTPAKILGKGRFGKVFRGTFEGSPCAVKRVEFDSENSNLFRQIKNEVEQLRNRCNHRNIIRYYCSKVMILIFDKKNGNMLFKTNVF